MMIIIMIIIMIILIHIYLSLSIYIYTYTYLCTYFSPRTDPFPGQQMDSPIHDSSLVFMIAYSTFNICSFDCPLVNIIWPRAKQCLVSGYRFFGGATRHGVVMPVVIPRLHSVGMTTLFTDEASLRMFVYFNIGIVCFLLIL